MIIIPAIDIRNGKCVRLVQGDYTKEKVYSTDPVAVAKNWQEQGASYLHVVDLDGAKDGKLVNFEVIKKIVHDLTIPIQVGGGIRNEKAIKELLSIGVARLILGTVAIENDEETAFILKKYTSRIAVALDVKNGNVMKKGWIESSGKESLAASLKLKKLGAERFIYTDIVKDGTLTEPNYSAIAQVIKTVNVPLIASGGISTIDAIRKLKTLGAEGVIIGKAFYEGKIDFKEATRVS